MLVQISTLNEPWKHKTKEAKVGDFIISPFGQCWPQTQNCRKLVMWPLKTIARRTEIQWRWFRMSLFRHSGHFWSFGAFLANFVTTQNVRKRRGARSLSHWIFSLEIYSILKTLSMFVIDIDISKRETKCTFMQTSCKLIVWLFLRLLRNCLRKYCFWFVFDRELENISRSEVFPWGRPLVRLVIEHLAFEDIHGWHCCTFNEFSTRDI